MNDLTKKTYKEMCNPKDLEKARDSGDIVNRIFKALKLIFPAWRQAIQSDEELEQIKKMWLKTLIEEKITTQEKISRGLKGARNHDSAFFPSIGQFIKWTKKTKLRVNEQAYKVFPELLSEHTQEQYNEMRKAGIAKLRKNHDF